MLETLSILLKVVIQLYIYALFSRLIIDWIRVLNQTWQPAGGMLFFCEAVYTITDPPIKFVRKFIPPLRVGNIAIDFGWMLVLVACNILMRIV